MITERQPRFYIGLIVFAAVMLLLILAAPPIQSSLGIYGLLLTELVIAACGVVPVFLLRYDIREVIPIRLPKLRQVFGVLLLWVGALFTVYLVTYLTLYLFPYQLYEVSKALGDYLTDAPFFVSLLISAVMPAVCEEILCRGFIQYTFSGLKNKWLIIGVIGVLFGIFHWSPFRFAPTMLLGLMLAYIMFETRNLALPVIFHFTNNAFTLAISYASPSGTAAIDPEMLSTNSVMYVGVILFFCTAVPWLLIAGSRLLKTMEENTPRRLKNKTLIAATIVSAFCFLTGIGITMLGTGTAMNGLKILDMGYTEYVGSGVTEPDFFPITIEEDGNYAISYSVESSSGADGSTSFTLTDGDGQEVLGMTAGSIFGNTQKQLTAGDYTLTFEYAYTDGKPGSVQVRFTVLKITS
jgi:membrane protease YdiL (CAAX protease family)